MTFYANVPPVIDPVRRQHLGGLQAGWNGHKGKPPTAEALAVLDRISLVPTNKGGWEIEVCTKGMEASIEIAPDGQIETVFWGRDTVMSIDGLRGG